MDKLNPNVAYKLFKSKGYIVLASYKNATTKILCEKDGYRYQISYNNLKCGKNPSLWGFHNIDNLEYNLNILLKKKQSTSTYLGYKIVQKGNRKRILVKFQCECGKIFEKVLEDAVYKTYLCCNDCALKKRGNTKRLGRKIVDFLEDMGYTVFNKDYPYRNTDYVEVEDSEGYRGFVSYSKIKHRGAGMSKFDVRVNKKHYIYNVNHWAKLHHMNVECLGFDEGNTRYKRGALKFKCACGNEFVTSLNAFQGGKFRCEECAKSISRYEFIFKKYLEDNNIEFYYQYSYNQCRDILPLPFDFYLKDYGCLIEIDGEGHFHPCNFNQISNEEALTTFEITKQHDEIKNNFCKENNIPLLRIPYFEFNMKDNYKQLFENFIRELTSPS